MWAAAIFPILFCIHDAEEIFTQHRWMREHGPRLKKRFPRMGKLLDSLGELSTGAFAIAALYRIVEMMAISSPLLLLVCGIAGVAFMVVNLLLAHKIGKSLAE